MTSEKSDNEARVRMRVPPLSVPPNVEVDFEVTCDHTAQQNSISPLIRGFKYSGVIGAD